MQQFHASDGLKLAYTIDDFTDPWLKAPTLLLLHAAMGHSRRYIPEFSTLEMGEVSVEGTAQALNNLYHDPRRRQRLAQAAFDAAQNPDYAWEAIAERFDRLFGELTR